MSGLFDTGLQPERTELAWRRTCLAFGIGSLIAMRLVPAAFGDAWWTLLGAAGLAVSGILWLYARCRYRVINERLHRDGDRARMPSAAPLFALLCIVLATALLCLGVVLVAAMSGRTGL